MGKTSKSTQTQTLPPELQAAALQGLTLAQDVGSLPAMNNFGPTVAAANLMQKSAMRNTNDAASAFGMRSSGNSTADLGLPKATQTAGGYSGYSTKPLYDASMASLPAGTRDLLKTFSYNPQTGAPPTNPNLTSTDLLHRLSGGRGGQAGTAGSGKGGQSLTDIIAGFQSGMNGGGRA